MRSYGHTVSQTDLWHELYDVVTEAIETLKRSIAGRTAKDGDTAKVTLFQHRLVSIENSPFYLKQFKRELMFKVGARPTK